MDLSLERRAQVHAALSDPVRVGIVDELALSDRSPTELGERFEIRSNLLAHHLHVLEVAGVIERVVSQGDRRRRYVRLVADWVRPLVRLPSFRPAGVVFVCTRNSARSQLAAAVWNDQSTVPATSGGTRPAEVVHPGAVRAARRRRLDLSRATPSSIDLGGLGDHLVVTVCDLAREELAVLGASRRRSGTGPLHWSVPDPAVGGRSADFDSAVEVLDARISTLVPLVHPV